jgi:EARP and GARP complex-interacting protein 1
MVELNEDSFRLDSKIFNHERGEIHRLTSSPNDKLIASVYTKKMMVMQSAILRIPENSEMHDPSKEILEFSDVEVLDTELYGKTISTTEFHPSADHIVASIVDGKILLFNRTEAKSVVVSEMTGKKSSGGGMFSGANQFVAIQENAIVSYDIRDSNNKAWQIEDGVSSVRTIDINPNKAFHIATGADEGVLKIFDVRNSKEPVFSTGHIHQHWIFSVSFNKFHDQLLLTSSSDGKVILTCASSCSSEAVPKDKVKSEDEVDDDNFQPQHEIKRSPLKDGLLETYTEHEESVYCVEWSAADPWTFASLSYDGRVIITRIPKKYKYQILL